MAVPWITPRYFRLHGPDFDQLLSSNVALYHLADKLCLKGLQNLAIERVAESCRRKKSGMSAAMIIGIHQYTGPESKLRKLSVDLAAHRYMLVPALDVEFYQPCIDGAEGFATAFIKAIKANPEPESNFFKDWKRTLPEK